MTAKSPAYPVLLQVMRKLGDYDRSMGVLTVLEGMARHALEQTCDLASIDIDPSDDERASTTREDVNGALVCLQEHSPREVLLALADVLDRVATQMEGEQMPTKAEGARQHALKLRTLAVPN